MGRPAVPFFDRVEKTETCWLWTGPLTPDGYANRVYEGRQDKAHRVAYKMLVGPIPDGLQLDHLCRVRHCVNPAHLEPVTNAVNQSRSNGRKGVLRVTACPQGHEYTPENTYIPPSRPNARHCKACLRAKPGGSWYRWQARKKAQAESQ